MPPSAASCSKTPSSGSSLLVNSLSKSCTCEAAQMSQQTPSYCDYVTWPFIKSISAQTHPQPRSTAPLLNTLWFMVMARQPLSDCQLMSTCDQTMQIGGKNDCKVRMGILQHSQDFTRWMWGLLGIWWRGVTCQPRATKSLCRRALVNNGRRENQQEWWCDRRIPAIWISKD